MWTKCGHRKLLEILGKMLLTLDSPCAKVVPTQETISCISLKKN